MFLFAFAVGAAIFIPIVQNDLEDRVEEKLIDNDIVGVTASFSGQDGTLVCATPLDDPDQARRLAEGLWGVRVISIDRTCQADDESTNDAPAVETSPSTDVTTVETTATTESPPPPDTAPALDSIVELVAGDPLFSQLAGWIETAGLAGEDGLGGDGPFTLLAPTDAAFDAAFDELGADAFGELTSDPEFLRTLLLHHVADGLILSDDMETGPLPMRDGTTVEVDAEEVTFASGGVAARVDDPATQLDIQATNGVVHAIDRILVPPGVDLAAPVAEPMTTAEYVGGRLVLSGVVADETQRAQLTAAPLANVDPANVVDDLTVDASTAPTAADIDRLAVVVEAMPANLVSGTATLEGAELRVEGVVLNVDARAAFERLGAVSVVDLVLTDRPIADDASAQVLEDELNEFVASNPILFEQSAVELTPAANAVIEQVAARMLLLDGVDIVVVGHTDTDGSADNNQLLSEGRAAVVLDALVRRGLAADRLTSEGRGGTEPVLTAEGTEDKVASRRVEFVVVAR